jgi:hypothetical protein
MKTIKQIYDEMPNEFSSRAMAKQLIQNGHSQYFIKNDKMLQWLLLNATRIGRRMWQKKSPNKQMTIPLATNLSLDEAIKICKKNGLKVMRPTSGWEEV